MRRLRSGGWWRRLLQRLRRPPASISLCSIEGHIWRPLGSIVFGRQCSACGAVEFDRNVPDGVEAYVRLFVDEGVIAGPPPDDEKTIRCVACGRAIPEFIPGPMQYGGCVYCGSPYGECPCRFDCAARAPFWFSEKTNNGAESCMCGPRCRCWTVAQGCGVKHQYEKSRGN
jgi:hypothetical protein